MDEDLLKIIKLLDETTKNIKTVIEKINVIIVNKRKIFESTNNNDSNNIFILHFSI